MHAIRHNISSSIWFGLKHALNKIEDHVIWKIGNEKDISFRREIWLGYKIKNAIILWD